MNRLAIISLALLVTLSISLAAMGRRGAEPSGGQPSASTVGSFGVGIVDGLHLTGTPIEVAVGTYRLKIGGLVEGPFSLTYSEITTMPSERRFAVLECPGVFRDEGVWTGVPLRALLERARVRPGATTVVFRSIDGSYEQTLPLERAMAAGVYLAYEFNGKVFDSRNGFPLRLVVEGKPGSLWVKWLGEIEVRAE